MLKNYFTLTLRHLAKHKGYAAINTLSLAVGMACALLMLIFIANELSYDRYHQNAAQVFRVVYGANDNDGSVRTPFPLSPALKAEFPDLKTVQFTNAGGAQILMRHGDRRYQESSLFFTEPEVFEIFTFPLAQGDSRTALREPFTVVLSREAAARYFGDRNPLEQSLTIKWANANYDLKVTGLLADRPRQSHIKFDFLISWATAQRIFQPASFFTDWTANFSITYVLLPKSRAPETMAQPFTDLLLRHLAVDTKPAPRLRLQPLTDIYLHSHLSGELGSNGNIIYLYLAAAIAVLVLGVASINYMNLATARTAQRANEISIRKVLGAGRVQVARQFLVEALVLSGLALLVALLLIELTLPLAGKLLGSRLTYHDLEQPRWLVVIVTATILTALISGSYPAFYLSGLNPQRLFKSAAQRRFSRGRLHHFLVIAQFAMSVVLIVAALTIGEQLRFVREKSLGFDKEQMLIIPKGRAIRARSELVKNVLRRNPNVLGMTISSGIPSRPLNVRIQSMPEGGNPQGAREPWPIAAVSVDYDFLATYGISLRAGRNFSRDLPQDSITAFLLNETAVRALGWTPEAAIGKSFAATYVVGDGTTENRRGQVIGVMKDFHFESLHAPIAPVAFICKPFWFYYVSIKLRPENMANTLADLKTAWETLTPDAPFEYNFLDDRFAQLYRAEQNWAIGIRLCSALAVLIACLGLFSLAAFAAEQRTKEIGVRKVLGASIASIVGLLSQEFVKLVLLANLVAWPIAYFAMNQWLQDFAYRIELRWWTFALAGGVALLIALLTVSAHAIKAALANPVDSLRYE